MFVVPAFPVREQPVGILFKSVADVALRNFELADRQIYLRGSVAGFFHLKNHFLQS